MLFSHDKTYFINVIQLRILRWQNYPSGLNIVTRVLARERWKEQSPNERRRCDEEKFRDNTIAGWRSQGMDQPEEVGEAAQGMDFPLGPLSGTQLCHFLTVVQCNQFGLLPFTRVK
jgi:hypothetical protein